MLEEKIDHKQPICKIFGIIKVIKMFRLSILKSYYRLMLNDLQRIYNLYEIRNPMFHLP